MTDWIRTGYHGTAFDCGDDIISQKKFLPSRGDEEWLGEGVYFFQYITDAKWWCTTVKSLDQYYILVAPLECDSKYVLDLDDPQDFGRFQEYARKIENRYQKCSDGTIRRVYNSVVIKQIQATARLKGLRPFEIITGSFDENRSFALLRDKRFNLKPKQIQYCVCNHSCIQGISVEEKVVKNGEQRSVG